MQEYIFKITLMRFLIDWIWCLKKRNQGYLQLDNKVAPIEEANTGGKAGFRFRTEQKDNFNT